jgi:hypothetical protein
MTGSGNQAEGNDKKSSKIEELTVNSGAPQEKTNKEAAQQVLPKDPAKQEKETTGKKESEEVTQPWGKPATIKKKEYDEHAKVVTDWGQIESIEDLLTYMNYLFGLADGTKEQNEERKAQKEVALKMFDHLADGDNIDGLTKANTGLEEGKLEGAKKALGFLGEKSSEKLRVNIAVVNQRIKNMGEAKKTLESPVEAYYWDNDTKEMQKAKYEPEVTWREVAALSSELDLCRDIKDDVERNNRIKELLKDEKKVHAYEALAVVGQEDLSVYRYMYATNGALCYDNAKKLLNYVEKSKTKVLSNGRSVSMSRVEELRTKLHRTRTDLQETCERLGIGGENSIRAWGNSAMDKLKKQYGNVFFKEKAEQKQRGMAMFYDVRTRIALEMREQLVRIQQASGLNDKITPQQEEDILKRSYELTRLWIMEGFESFSRARSGSKENIKESSPNPMEELFGPIVKEYNQKEIDEFKKLIEGDAFGFGKDKWLDPLERNRRAEVLEYNKQAQIADKEEARIVMLTIDISTNDGKNMQEELKSGSLLMVDKKERAELAKKREDILKKRSAIRRGRIGTWDISPTEKESIRVLDEDLEKIDKQIKQCHLNSMARLQALSACGENLRNGVDPIGNDKPAEYSTGREEFSGKLVKVTGSRTKDSSILESIRKTKGDIKKDKYMGYMSGDGSKSLTQLAYERVRNSSTISPDIVGINMINEDDNDAKHAKLIKIKEITAKNKEDAEGREKLDKAREQMSKMTAEIDRDRTSNNTLTNSLIEKLVEYNADAVKLNEALKQLRHTEETARTQRDTSKTELDKIEKYKKEIDKKIEAFKNNEGILKKAEEDAQKKEKEAVETIVNDFIKSVSEIKDDTKFIKLPTDIVNELDKLKKVDCKNDLSDYKTNILEKVKAYYTDNVKANVNSNTEAMVDEIAKLYTEMETKVVESITKSAAKVKVELLKAVNGIEVEITDYETAGLKNGNTTDDIIKEATKTSKTAIQAWFNNVNNKPAGLDIGDANMTKVIMDINNPPETEEIKKIEVKLKAKQAEFDKDQADLERKEGERKEKEEERKELTEKIRNEHLKGKYDQIIGFDDTTGYSKLTEEGEKLKAEHDANFEKSAKPKTGAPPVVTRLFSAITTMNNDISITKIEKDLKENRDRIKKEEEKRKERIKEAELGTSK